jgi:hypothetical protein
MDRAQNAFSPTVFPNFTDYPSLAARGPRLFSSKDSTRPMVKQSECSASIPKNDTAELISTRWMF